MTILHVYGLHPKFVCALIEPVKYEVKQAHVIGAVYLFLGLNQFLRLNMHFWIYDYIQIKTALK